MRQLLGVAPQIDATHREQRKASPASVVLLDFDDRPRKRMVVVQITP